MGIELNAIRIVCNLQGFYEQAMNGKTRALAIGYVLFVLNQIVK